MGALKSMGAHPGRSIGPFRRTWSDGRGAIHYALGLQRRESSPCFVVYVATSVIELSEPALRAGLARRLLAARAEARRCADRADLPLFPTALKEHHHDR